MKPLISIETVPISIEYVEKKTPHKSTQSAELKISRQDHKMTIQSNPIRLPAMDSFESSSSADWNNLTYTATSQYSDDGNLQMSVKLGKNTQNSFAYQQFGRGIEGMMNSLTESSGASYQFENMQINFDMKQLANGIQSSNNVEASFLPPDLELKVVEWPKVIIKYVGDPIYFPKSADPNYMPSDALDAVSGGRPAFDVKA